MGAVPFGMGEVLRPGPGADVAHEERRVDVMREEDLIAQLPRTGVHTRGLDVQAPAVQPSHPLLELGVVVLQAQAAQALGATIPGQEAAGGAPARSQREQAPQERRHSRARQSSGQGPWEK